MTTDEARELLTESIEHVWESHFDGETICVAMNRTEVDAIDTILAALAASEAARERAERDNTKLRAAWPEYHKRDNMLETSLSGRWMLNGDPNMIEHPTRDSAINAAAGINATHTEQPAKGEGE